MTEVEIKPKNLEKPWFSKGLKKFSKTKHIFIKFLKNQSTEA